MPCFSYLHTLVPVVFCQIKETYGLARHLIICVIKIVPTSMRIAKQPDYLRPDKRKMTVYGNAIVLIVICIKLKLYPRTEGIETSLFLLFITSSKTTNSAKYRHYKGISSY